ncbi:MAG TPA: SRPBCC family protein [Thermoleophilaceae bacterium]|jgi:hypothetical protein
MARTAQAAVIVPLAPEAAMTLWTDVRRWPTFVEGFARPLDLDDGWPERGAKVVWESIPGGRGRVTERVVESGTARFATQVFEDALEGRQAFRVTEDAEGARVEVSLEYQLNKYGPFQAVADAIFIRRALRDALRRTLHRFAVEAEEEAALR